MNKRRRYKAKRRRKARLAALRWFWCVSRMRDDLLNMSPKAPWVMD